MENKRYAKKYITRKKMNILMICPDWFPFSAGLAQSCYEICKSFENHGHKVKVIVLKDKKIDKKDLEVIAIPYLFRLFGRFPIVYNLYSKIEKEIEWSDVICLFSYMFLMNSKVVALKKAGKYNKPVIHFYRGSLEPDVLPYLSLTIRLGKKIYDRTFAKPLFEDVDAVISNSEPALAIMKKNYKVDIKKLYYVNSALHIEDYITRKEKKKRVLFIGRLVENKGIQLFPRIMEHIPSDWSFTIVGNGPLDTVIKSLQAKYENIDHKEKLPHKELIRLIAESSMLILPTFAEGSPRAVMEASACGIPSICFKVGDVVNMIPPDCGFAIDPFNIDIFCEKVKYLIKNDKIRIEMGQKAREFAEHNLDWKKVYPKIEKIITSTIERSKS